MSIAEALIFDMQRFSIHDGPGIRTVVFLKGCPLRCIWCHNPEAWSNKPQLLFDAHACLGCGACVATCPHQCHIYEANQHRLDLHDCVGCGQCAVLCPGALRLAGKRLSARQVMDFVLRDKLFYRDNGGVTLSGGEPLMQNNFCTSFLMLAKEHKLHTCVETSGYCEYDSLEELRPLTDLFLFDYKESDDARHFAWIGVGNERIIANLMELDARGAQSILRCPIIPGYNDREEHFIKIAELAESMRHVQEIHIEPYHNLGSSKWERLGGKAPIDFSMPTNEQIAVWMRSVASHTSIMVKRS